MLKKHSTLTYTTLAIFFVVLVSFLANKQTVKMYEKTLKEDVVINVEEVETFLTTQYSSYMDDIAFLYATPPIEGLTRSYSNNNIDPLDGTTTALWKDRLSQIFRSFVQNNKEYFQLRIIDKDGREIVRVERLDGQVARRDNNDLQDKSKHRYFLDGKDLAENQTYVSTITLNRDFNKVSFPYTPTLRVTRAIFDNKNRFFGIIIANIDMRENLKLVNELVTNKFDLIITDGEGYFIEHPEDELKFSRDLSPQRQLNSTYTLDKQSDYSLQIYSDTRTSYFGASKEIKVAPDGSGATLDVSVLLPKDTYDKELNDVRVTSFSAFVGLLAVAMFGFYYLNRTNQRLNQLLFAAEESKAAVDATDDAIALIAKDWKISAVNDSFQKLFLLHRDDVVGTRFSDVLVALGDIHFISCINKVELEDVIATYDWQYTTENGKPKWLRTKTKIMPTRLSGGVSGYAVAIVNVTKEVKSQKKIELINEGLEHAVAEKTKELVVARDKAMEVSKLKSNFISTISHEMRTPLNGIVGATTLLKNEQDKEKQQQLLQMAETSVDALRTLINDILDLSKIEAGKLELNYRTFNPEALIESLTSTMSVVANDKGLGLYIDTGQLNLMSIKSDPHRLTQVINNILNNAIKFTEKGHITIKLWSSESDDKCWLHLDITDTGIGITSDNLNKLFKAFSQADNSIAGKFGGTGLGLSISKEIVSLLGGEISAVSEAGTGSTFSLRIPVKEWQKKPEDGRTRLQGKECGLIISEPPLQDNITNLIESIGGTTRLVFPPFSDNDGMNYPYFFVDAESDNYERFLLFWNGLTDDSVKPKLFILSRISMSSSNLPKGAISLIKPVYRSVLLATILDSRHSSSLPSQDAKPERRSTAVSEAERKNVSDNLNYNVLIVDDNEINRQVAQFTLEPLGVNIQTAVNGVEAIELLNTSTLQFDAILMDCNMPIMNGYETTLAIRNGNAGTHYSTIPIIALTANAMKGEQEKCRHVGMDDYITKPIEPDILLQKLSHAVSRAPSKTTNSEEETIDSNVQSSDEPSSTEVWQKDMALARLGGREALLKQLLKLFISSSEDKLIALEAAMKSEDREQIRFNAHALKGTSGDIGAEILRATADTLEQGALVDDMTTLTALLDKIESQYTMTLEMINAFLEDT